MTLQIVIVPVQFHATYRPCPIARDYVRGTMYLALLLSDSSFSFSTSRQWFVLSLERKPVRFFTFCVFYRSRISEAFSSSSSSFACSLCCSFWKRRRFVMIHVCTPTTVCRFLADRSWLLSLTVKIHTCR